ncbi:MAG: Endonuclease 4 [Candidatus Anoxychlamydiales bacterium]|nr:Endonuclease 4 [Candidatus Anoxychlamydiales bacterium]
MDKKNILIGTHTSIAGGVSNSIYRAKEIGANTMQIFTANQRQWNSKPISNDEIERFKKARKECNIEKVVSHNSYLINLGSPKPQGRAISKKAFLEEIDRCKKLEIDYLVFHPGSALDSEEEDSLNKIVESILSFKEFLEDDKTMLLLETTAGQGSNMGYKFEHLKYILDKTQKNIPIGVCLDTCHIFSAGYDIRDEKSWLDTIEKFDEIINLKNLHVFHVNDSKCDFNSRRDRHESIGKGKIGLDSFKFLMREKRFDRVIKILETPIEALYKDEIQLLKSFIR